MAKKKEHIPNYSSTTKKGVLYYRTRITDADGKRVDLYATEIPQREPHGG